MDGTEHLSYLLQKDGTRDTTTGTTALHGLVSKDPAEVSAFLSTKNDADDNKWVLEVLKYT
jgi:hypothetical protein